METENQSIHPNQIFQIAKAKATENVFFKKHLRGYSSAEIDPLVAKLYQVFSAKIDCTTCANCCSHLEPGIDESDIERLAFTKNMDPIDFKRAHVAFDGDALFLVAKPCLFLEDKQCSVYADRPLSCAAYPHLEQANFKYKRNVWSNYLVCPIVFEVIESLKKELNFNGQ